MQRVENAICVKCNFFGHNWDYYSVNITHTEQILVQLVDSVVANTRGFFFGPVLRYATTTHFLSAEAQSNSHQKYSFLLSEYHGHMLSIVLSNFETFVYRYKNETIFKLESVLFLNYIIFELSTFSMAQESILFENLYIFLVKNFHIIVSIVSQCLQLIYL